MNGKSKISRKRMPALSISMMLAMMLTLPLVTTGCKDRTAGEAANADSEQPAPAATEEAIPGDPRPATGNDPNEPARVSREGDEPMRDNDGSDPSLGRKIPVATADNIASVCKGGNAFAVDLYQRLAAAEGNLFFSPLSISVALAMTYAGARGQTAEEMAEVMHFLPEHQRLHPAYKALMDTLLSAQDSAEPPYTIDIANRLWGQAGLEFLPVFLGTTRDFYGAELAQVDFLDETETARLTINDWVAGRTRQKILDLIPPGALNKASRLVLTNAIYFHGKWARQFAEDRTRPEPFFTTPQDSTDVPMMIQRAEYAHGAFDGGTALQLPYQQDDLAMVVLLPDAKDGLADLERRLDAGMLKQWLDNLFMREVELHLPKFEMTSSFELADVLQAMGMVTPFSSSADFSRMTGGRDLAIDRVIHKAFVDVQEEGTEAAAATAVTMKLTSVQHPPQRLEFRADHPFLFLIRDLRTNAILFCGRLVDPK